MVNLFFLLTWLAYGLRGTGFLLKLFQVEEAAYFVSYVKILSAIVRVDRIGKSSNPFSRLETVFLFRDKLLKQKSLNSV